jgi:hypothetical protein
LAPYTAAASGETIPIAFSTGVPVPASNLNAVYVKVANQGNPAQVSGCTGTAAAPTSIGAESFGQLVGGVLCVYEDAATNLAELLPGSATQKVRKSGGGVVGLFKSADPNTSDPTPFVVTGYGSWALKTP